MMADHGELCEGQEATYCMNGGTCFRIPSMDTLSCVCKDDYKGSRCEQFQLQSKFTEAGEAGLIAAVVIITLLILVVLGFVIYYIRRVLKAKQQSQQNNQGQYWRDIERWRKSAAPNVTKIKASEEPTNHPIRFLDPVC